LIFNIETKIINHRFGKKFLIKQMS